MHLFCIINTMGTDHMVTQGKQGKSEGFDSCDRPSNLTQIGLKSSIFQPCDLEIWLMTSKNDRTPLLHYIKLCASSQTPLLSRKAQFGSKSVIFCPVWPWNSMEELEQGKSEGFDSCDWPSNLTQIGFKSSIFSPVWPWKLMDDPEKF